MLRNKKIKAIVYYLILLIESFVMYSLIWYFFVENKLYHCSDPIPILGFHPPFVHDSQYGDYWISSKSSTYSLWYFFVLLILSTPGVLTGIILKKFRMVKIVLAVFLGFVVLIVLNGFSLSTSQAPSRLSLDHQTGNYRIYKLGGNYVVSYKDGNKEEELTYVGISKISLDEYIGKNIKITTDEETKKSYCHSGTEQCIQKKCYRVTESNYSDFCSINIESIEILSSSN